MASTFITDINTEYEKLHRAFEEQVWGTKMALGGAEYSTSELTRTKGEMEDFLADASKLRRARELLESGDSLSADERKTLEMLVRTFGC